MASPLRAECIVTAPPEEVWRAIIEHPPRYASWPWFGAGPDPRLKGIQLSDGATSIRTGIRRRVVFDTGAIMERFTSFDPERAIAWDIIADDLGNTALAKSRITLENWPEDQRVSRQTRVRWVMEPRPGNVFKRLAFWMQAEKRAARMMQESLDGLAKALDRPVRGRLAVTSR